MTGSGVAEFVEGFALILTRAGMQRMASRVFAALLASESGELTAKQIAEALGVSPAAVSGAVNYLTRTGLAVRARHPGARVDHYRVEDSTWAEAMATESERIDELADWLGQGARAVPAGSDAEKRLHETRDFFLFIAAEMPKLVERWQASRRSGEAVER